MKPSAAFAVVFPKVPFQPQPSRRPARLPRRMRAIWASYELLVAAARAELRVRTIPAQRATTDVPEYAHYMPYAKFKEFIEPLLSGRRDNPCLWLNIPQSMNDPEEGAVLRRIVVDSAPFRADARIPDKLLRDRVKNVKKPNHAKSIEAFFDPSRAAPLPLFLLSLTQYPDKLTYWRLYGGDGDGASIALSQRQLLSAVEKINHTKKFSAAVIQVSYDVTDAANAVLHVLQPLQQLEDEITTAESRGALSRRDHETVTAIRRSAQSWLTAVRHCFKDPAYADEAEIRIILVPLSEEHLPGFGKSLTFHEDGRVPLKGLLPMFQPNTGGCITLGPRYKNAEAVAQAIQIAFTERQLVNWNIRLSSQRYRSREVEPNGRSQTTINNEVTVRTRK